jgi:hypothetical protein
MSLTLRGTAGEEAVRGSRTAIRCVLWCILLLGYPAAAIAAKLHPAWDLNIIAFSAPFVSGSALGLLYTGTRWRPAPRAVHARPAALTLRQVLWAGFFASPFLIAIAQSDPGRLRVVDYCGTVMFLACPAALILRWLFARRARQPVDRKVYELGQNLAWTRQDVSRMHRLLSDLAGIAGVGLSDGTGDHIRRRHLRPVRTPRSDDTGPQKAVLGAAPAFMVGEQHRGEGKRAQ